MANLEVMSVSGNEDKTLVIARQSSNCSTGVPIKKRRFPLVRMTSSPPPEPSTHHAENDTPQKELCKPTQDSSLSDASIVTNSPGISDASKSSFRMEMKGRPADTNFNLVQNNVNLSRVKLEEPSLSIFSGSTDNMDSKKMLTSDTKLQLAPNEGLALNNGKEIAIKERVQRACKLELSTVTENAELSLGLKEPLIPSLAGQNIEQSFQKPDKVDPPSFSLSLGKGIPISNNNVDDDRARVPANRCNWDLNTTMDAWEGSTGDATTAADQGALGFDGSSNGIGGLQDARLSTISSAGIFGVGADLGQPTTGAGEQRSYLPMMSLCASKQYKSDDSLHLRLCTSFLPSNFSVETSGLLSKVASSSIQPSSNFLGMLPTGNPNSVSCMTVKLESHDESAKPYLAEARGDPTRSLDLRAVKREVVEKQSLETLKKSVTSPQKLVQHVPVKSEPVQVNQETQRKAKETSYQSDGRVAQGEKNCSSMHVKPLNSQNPCPSALPTCSTELSMSGDPSKLPEYADCTTKEVGINSATPDGSCNNFDQVASETVVPYVDHQIIGSNVSDGITETLGAKDLITKESGNCGHTEMPGLNVTNDHTTDSHGNVEGSVSDEEKFNISEEDSFSSDFESDGNHAQVAPGDGRGRQFREDDEEYEDGEFREQLLHGSSEGPIVEKREAEDDNLGGSDMDIGSPCDGIIMEPGVNEEERKLEDRFETSDEHIKECVGAVINEKANQGIDKDGSVKLVHVKECDVSLTVDVAGTGYDEKSHINNTPRKLLDQVGGKDTQKGHEMELSSAGATTTGSQDSVTAGVQDAGDNSKGTETLEKVDSTLPKTDASLNVDAASKDANTGGNRSRIITLPRATNVSPCRTRSIQGRSFPSRSGRERFFDFDGENPRGNRDEIYNDGPRKYSRDRFQDQSFRNSRQNFMRGRGRASGRSDAQRGNWDSSRDFPSENYNGPSDYRFSRHKRAPPDGELDCRGFIAPVPNGAFIGSGRGGGRKPLNDELPSFRQPLPRRHSPGGRDVPATRGNQMVRRIPRNISPSRHMGEDRSDMVGLRRGDKFMRGLPDDNSMDNPVFPRPQHSYDGVENQFVRGNRNFSSVQRRGGLSRIRSKSPIRSRTRSPGPWSPPRRRSPDEFNGLPELIHRRSPANNYRRRSPPYISRPGNDLRDMESGRDHGHLRSAMPNRRSPPDQVLPRRRFDILDPRERTDGDEYFGRFNELGGDGNGDERRKSGEGRGPVRNFRPPFNNGADTDNFRFHVEDGPPRPFRFCPEPDLEFLERNDLREREFDGRIKGRSLNASRRTRTMEEQEGNYRHGGQEWHDDGFDDVSRGKRRRF